MDSCKLWLAARPPATREELERVVRKEKIEALATWLINHFTCDPSKYREMSPILIVKGPSGCGKTTTLRYIAGEIGIPIKEYHDTTDDTATYHATHTMDRPTSIDFAKRQANKFEQFVLNHLKFASLPTLDDDSNQISVHSQTLPTKPKLSPANGVIILVETPMSIVKSRSILIDSMFRLRQRIQQLSRCIRRRVVIVFETLENDAHLLMPVKTKQKLQIDEITFNPVTKTNLAKLVKSLIGERALDKDQMDIVISHCDGDVRSCINSLQIMFAHKINLNDTQFAHPSRAKRMRHELSLNTAMLKGENLQVNFFHVLGKIFYQKREYPDNSTYRHQPPKKYRSVERPYPTENSSNALLEMLDISPELLISWLHHNYSKFCNVQDVLKASIFLENLSASDMTSLNSLQSTQFYESHYHCDQIQYIISIEATTYSLYTDNSEKDTNANHKKKINVKGESKILRSSVDTVPDSDNTDNGKRPFKKINFEKPPCHQLNLLLEDYKSFVDKCSEEFTMIDRKKLCLDHMPYISSLDYFQSGYGTIGAKYNEFKFGRSISDLETLDLDLKNVINTYGHKVTEDLLNDGNCDQIFTDDLFDDFTD